MEDVSGNSGAFSGTTAKNVVAATARSGRRLVAWTGLEVAAWVDARLHMGKYAHGALDLAGPDGSAGSIIVDMVFNAGLASSHCLGRPGLREVPRGIATFKPVAAALGITQKGHRRRFTAALKGMVTRADVTAALLQLVPGASDEKRAAFLAYPAGLAGTGTGAGAFGGRGRFESSADDMSAIERASDAGSDAGLGFAAGRGLSQKIKMPPPLAIGAGGEASAQEVAEDGVFGAEAAAAAAALDVAEGLRPAEGTVEGVPQEEVPPGGRPGHRFRGASGGTRDLDFGTDAGSSVAISPAEAARRRKAAALERREEALRRAEALPRGWLVEEWLPSIGLPQLAAVFSRGGVLAPGLLQLDEKSLSGGGGEGGGLGIADPLHRRSVLSGVRFLVQSGFDVEG